MVNMLKIRKEAGMELNINLLCFMQRLTEPLKKYIKNLDYKEYVNKTLELTSGSINNITESDPDLLYSRLENIDEEDILTYFELDKDTDPSVWSCIANFLALVSYFSYNVTGEKYLPETIESVDEETVKDYFITYKKLVKTYEELSSLDASFQNEEYLKDKLVTYYFKFLFEDYN